MPVVVIHTYGPSIWGAEAGGSVFKDSLGYRISSGQPRKHRETLSQNNQIVVGVVTTTTIIERERKEVKICHECQTLLRSLPFSVHRKLE